MKVRLVATALLFVGGASLAAAQAVSNRAPFTVGTGLRSLHDDDPDLQRLDFPGLFGLGMPGYDRANGLSLPVSVSFAVNSRLAVEPRVTYRSQLGRIDPWLDVVDSVGRASALSVQGGRGTFTNDAWFRRDAINSLEAISVGNDARNYFRATRGEAKFTWHSDTGETYTGLYAGIRGEHALSVRPGAGALGGPWSFFGRHGEDDMLRVNPQIDNGVIRSVIVGADVRRPEGDVTWRATLDVELGRTQLDSIAGLPSIPTHNFGQTTFDGVVSFPTFGAQSIDFHGHAVVSSGSTPRQRLVYLGGSGTLPTFDLLSLAGDRLVYLDGRYLIPLERFDIPLLGPPTVSLRDAIGGTGFGALPSLHQNIGARIGFGPVYVGFVVDPATRRRHYDGGFSLLN